MKKVSISRQFYWINHYKGEGIEPTYKYFSLVVSEDKIELCIFGIGFAWEDLYD